MDKQYLKVGGTAMGTKVAPSVANFFMGDFEAEHVQPYPKLCTLYWRYLDDIIGI